MVDDAWLVEPDTNSVLMSGHYMARHVIYSNYFDGVEAAVTQAVETATAGIEPSGMMLDMVAESNTFHELREGVSLWAKQSNQKSFRPYS